MGARSRRWALPAALGSTLGLGLLSCGDILGSRDFRVGECDEGARHCAGNTPQTCTDGAWASEADCAHQTCQQDTGVCAGECGPEDRRCAGEVPEACDNDGHWPLVSDGSACDGGTHCGGGQCLGDCVPGDLRCLANTPQRCQPGGQWLDQPAGPCVNQTCLSGACTGFCALGDAQCQGQTPEACDLNGNWRDEPACSSACVAGSCPGPSCAELAPKCGPKGNESCCLSPVVLGGAYNRSNDANYPASISDFRLDRFEVTVGRFRAFVAGYPGNKPLPGAGLHPLIAGSGWRSAWDKSLPVDQSALMSAVSCGNDHTWTDSHGAKENLPVNCLSWYLAFAFCAWDGGRLPTEAEWNYAAAGGGEQRIFPWSNPPTSGTVGSKYAVYFNKPIARVGAKSPAGDGKWGQADLAGNVNEWTLDFFNALYETGVCQDCASVVQKSPELLRVQRGGNWYFAAQEMLTTTRGYDPPDGADAYQGVRCARSP